MARRKTTWSEFKALVALKKTSVQYQNQTTQYRIWTVDNTDEYYLFIEISDPASADQTDFETNYLPTANRPYEPRAPDGTVYKRGTEKTVGKTLKFDGYKFNAPAGVNTKYQKQITPVLIELVGAYCRVKGGNDDDKLQFRIVDVDNILGYGAGLVLAHIGRDIAKIALEEMVSVESDSALDINAGFYLEIEYENTGAEDAQVAGAYKYFS